MVILNSSTQSTSYSVILMTFCLLFLFIGCKKERESTDVIVNVKMLDENENSLTDKSGVKISLSGGTG